MFYSSFLRIFFVFNVLGGLSFAAQQYTQQQPAQQQPRYAQPAQQQPAQQQPRYAQPAQQQPAQQQPRYAQPAQQQPAQQQPRYAQPAQQQPAQQQPRYAQPAQQQPAQQQPRYAQPAQQQPAQQQPRYAQPAQQPQQQPAQQPQQQPVAQPNPSSSQDLFSGFKTSVELGYAIFPSLMGGTADPLNGILGGLDIGYGYTFSHSYYIGGQGFFHYSLPEVTQTIPIIGKVTESAHLSYGAALQAGYVINNVLPYVELGYSMQQVKQTIGTAPAISNSIKGPLLGAGIDYVFTSFFIGAEANMVLYSNSSSNNASSKSTSSTSTNVTNILLKFGFIF